MKRRRAYSDHVRPADRSGRRRVTQDSIDEMTALRRQGVTFRDIGARLGCSERTARRFVGQVLPQLHVPRATPELETDPRALRERLLSEFIELLYADRRLRSVTVTWHRVNDSSNRAEYGGPPSILFLSEAERLLR